MKFVSRANLLLGGELDFYPHKECFGKVALQRYHGVSTENYHFVWKEAKIKRIG
jgi:hypothetical protein